MPTTLPPILLRAPMVERTSLTVTSAWLQWLEASYLRQGGQEAATNTELAGGVAANRDYITQVEGDLGSTNTTVASLEAELTALQEAFLQLAQEVEALTGRVTTLETAVTALTGRVDALETTSTAQETRLAALEAWKTALQAALPAVVTVATVPALANDPATAILLENDLTANWRPPLNTNDAGLAAGINAVRNALAA